MMMSPGRWSVARRVNTATWETLVLPVAALANIKTTCAMPQDLEAWRAQGVTVSNGILLEGPSRFAGELGRARNGRLGLPLAVPRDGTASYGALIHNSCKFSCCRETS